MIEYPNMTQKDSFLQKIFYQISLEKNPGLWQDDSDSTDKNIERIKFLSGFRETQYKVQLDKTKSSTRKNNNLAKALKEKGNKQFTGGDCYSALTLYNQALIYTTDDAPEYSTLLANRSAIWADLKKHSLAVSDIDLALTADYPHHLRFKLYERRAKCVFSLKMFNQAVDDVKKSLEYLKCSNLSEEKLKSKEQELMKVLALMERECSKNAPGEASDSDVDTLHSETDTNLALDNPNRQFPSFSEAVQIKYADNRGRYAVASRDIKIGQYSQHTLYICTYNKSVNS